MSKKFSLNVNIQLLPNSSEKYIPIYQTEGSSGVDLYAAVDGAMVIPKQSCFAVPTGIAVGIPKGYEGQVRPRSGLALKHGLTVLNTPGTIDSDYRGEILVLLWNPTHNDYVINRGDRIAQLVFVPVCRANFTVVDSLDLTERGDGGFGSTGK